MSLYTNKIEGILCFTLTLYKMQLIFKWIQETHQCRKVIVMVQGLVRSVIFNQQLHDII